MKILEITRALEQYLAEHPRATVAEDDEVVFTLPAARYSIAGDQGKCLLHLWSSERNMVRRVLGAEPRKNELTLTVQRFGQAHTNLMHVLADGEPDSPAGRDAARAQFRQALRRAMQRHFPDYQVERFTSAPDLEHSFGPVYARGTMHRGRATTAALGAWAGETQASVDSSVATALLWLDAVREKARACEGLVVVVPEGKSAVVRARMAWLAGKHRLLEFSQREGTLHEIDCSDRGNIQTRLVQAPARNAIYERFAEPIARILRLLPEAQVSAPSSSEIVFRYRGLEFARSRVAVEAASFRRGVETVFGIGAEETPLTDDNEARLAELVERLRQSRSPVPCPIDPLWRLAAERWMESLVVENVAALDARLDQRFVYSQVPAFSASDRAMIDVLTCTREGRLAVLELKADEDFHLPIQGLDYWARVRWHNDRREFQKFGYFAGREISPEPPLLILVAPALRIHPRTDTILRHVSPEIDWEFVAVDERWRAGLKVVFRKHKP